jgi:hypothetical protein
VKNPTVLVVFVLLVIPAMYLISYIVSQIRKKGAKGLDALSNPSQNSNYQNSSGREPLRTRVIAKRISLLALLGVVAALLGLFGVVAYYFLG